MKRIALFMPTLGGGGAERVMIDLASGFAERGHEVYLLVAAATGSLLQAVPPNVILVDLRAGRVMLAILPLARWLGQFRPSVLLTSQAHASTAAFIARRLARLHTPLLMREESTPSVNLRHLRGLRGSAWRALLRHVYRRADVVIAVSRGVADDLQGYLNCRLNNLKVIYNPVITPEIYQKAREPIEHPWFKEDQEVPVVLAVGRLTEAKNYPLLLCAFAQAIRQRPARLVILGEGEERPKLERILLELGIAEAVALPGFDSNPFRYMSKCALYVMSSDWEGLPGSLLQALALCGNVISTDCPSGPSEVLSAGQFGKLVPTGDQLAMTAAIVWQLTSKKHLEDASGIQEWIGQFLESSVISQYDQLIEREVMNA